MNTRHHRPALAALAALVVGLTAADLAGPQVARAAVEDVVVLIDGYEVYGQVAGGVDPENPPWVTATLVDGAGERKARASLTAGSDGRFELKFLSGGIAERRPIRVRPGDTLQLAIDDLTGTEPSEVSIPVPKLTAAADPAADTVAGEAPAGVNVSLTARSADGKLVTRSAKADAAGRWSIALADRLDIRPEVYGSVLYFDEMGFVYQTSWAVPGLVADIGAVEFAVRARPGDVARACIVGADGAVRGTTTSVAWAGTADIAPRDAAGERVAILPGDRIEVAFEGGSSIDLGSLALAVPPLAARVDPDRDAVDGRAEPGRAVAVSLRTADGTAVEHTATADAGGRWRADFAGVGIGWDTGVTVVQTDVPAVHLVAFAPRLGWVDPFVAAAHGRGPAGAVVRMTVATAGGVPRGEATGRVGVDGTFDLAVFPSSTEAPVAGREAGSVVAGGPIGIANGSAAAVDASIAPIALDAGDVVTVTIDGVPSSVVHQPITVRPNLGRDTVDGLAVPGAWVEVHLDDLEATAGAVADADGRWKVDFGGVADIRPGTRVRAVVFDHGQVRRELAFPAFRASAQANGERVRVEGQPGLAADVDLERGGKVIATGRCIVERAPCDAVLADAAGAAVWLAADDLVVVYPEGAAAASIRVFPLSAHIDKSGSDVVGLAPPTQPVLIQFTNDQGMATPIGTTTDADEAGVYDLEISPSQADLMVPGLVADVFHTLSDGHRLWARGVLEIVRATVGDPIVRGVAEPGSVVTATMYQEGIAAVAPVRAALAPARAGEGVHEGDGDADFAAGEGIAGGDGRFAVTLHDPDSGAPVPLGDERLLDVRHRRGMRELSVRTLAAWRLGPGGAVAGLTGWSNTPVQAFHYLTASPGDQTFVTVAGASDAAGVFVLPEPPVDRSRVRAVEVVAYQSDGDELRRWVDGRAGAVYLPRVGGR